MTNEDEDLYWLTITVLQEAGGEPPEGKLGVAWVVMNRANRGKIRVPDVVLKPWAFSCWNTTSPTRKLITTRKDRTWELCEAASRAAYFGTECDPTFGSTHYLNPAVLPKLPPWYSRKLVRAVLGAHHFLQVD